jgi:hypothetical protein
VSGGRLGMCNDIELGVRQRGVVDVEGLRLRWVQRSIFGYHSELEKDSYTERATSRR